jgi:hypothetical protein
MASTHDAASDQETPNAVHQDRTAAAEWGPRVAGVRIWVAFEDLV